MTRLFAGAFGHRYIFKPRRPKLDTHRVDKLDAHFLQNRFE